MNIFKIIRFLDMLKKDYKYGFLSAELNRHDFLTHSIYIMSPWMWGHQCLYRSLLYYLLNAAKATVNIGLKIHYNKTRLGHCWITVNGIVVDQRDEDNAAYYAKLFSHKKNVYYWLPVNHHGAKKMPVGVKLPSPAPVWFEHEE